MQRKRPSQFLRNGLSLVTLAGLLGCSGHQGNRTLVTFLQWGSVQGLLVGWHLLPATQHSYRLRVYSPAVNSGLPEGATARATAHTSGHDPWGQTIEQEYWGGFAWNFVQGKDVSPDARWQIFTCATRSSPLFETSAYEQCVLDRLWGTVFQLLDAQDQALFVLDPNWIQHVCWQGTELQDESGQRWHFSEPRRSR